MFITSEFSAYPSGRRGGDDARFIERIVSVPVTGDPDALWAEVAPLADSLPPDAVLSVSEQHTIAAAGVAARLGLPHTSLAAAQAARDKASCRELMRAAGLAQPAFARARTATEAAEAADAIGYPVVVKPVDGSASANVAVAGTQADVRAAFAAIESQESYGRSAAARREALVEEFLVGELVSAETMTAGGQTRVLGFVNRILTPPPHQVELGGCFPARVAGEAEAAETARSALQAIGFDLGAAHIEIMLTRAGPRIIEINGRLTGGMMPMVLSAAYGRDIFPVLAELHATSTMPELPPPRHVAAIRSLVASRPGRLARITESPGRDAPWVVDYDIRRHVGDWLAPPRTNRDRCGSVICTGPDQATAMARCGELLATTDLVITQDQEPSVA